MEKKRILTMTLGSLLVLAIGQFGCAGTGHRTMMGDDMSGAATMQKEPMENGMPNSMDTMKSDTMKDDSMGKDMPDSNDMMK